ncbi:hypothetical protein KDE13_05785 [Campylobacter sp. faydin G-140]|uniref:hypothetical protein n=1 Tax=Campylobacter anatolicus TaxID=2829105 RepID=UPI001B93139A|nr:hypothetical protein [Campylobacter anatolicus]MBR8465862.1 hypothetical protein [Campylobacter anatolicus]
MRKFILFITTCIATFSFDIDDFDKGVDALSSENFKAAYEIFEVGCEARDELSCEELGLMYINGQVSDEMDTTKASHFDVGINYLMKSCDLGYANACSDVVDLRDILKKEAGYELSVGVYENALLRYNELTSELKNVEHNATQSE